MQSDKIKKILVKHREIFKILENYDKTRTLPFQRKRIDITLSVRTINQLKNLNKKTSTPISYLIEEAIKEKIK